KLKAEHASLDQAIEEELGRPFPNSTLLSDLKRQKLRIKDEIQRISGP
ncbi:MAG: YdcH family protein, partial [Proteobacteria bacterium]|nr:YdcH family protein [Pseudomonadota bacterium]